MAFAHCFSNKRYGCREPGHFTQHILSSNPLFLFPCLAKFLAVSNLGLSVEECVPGMLGSAGGKRDS